MRNIPHRKAVAAYCAIAFFFLGIGTKAWSQVSYITLENQIPTHFWGQKIESWWWSDIKSSWEDFAKSHLVTDNLKVQSKPLEISENNLTFRDTVYLPSLFDLYLFKRRGAFGLLSTGGNIVVLPVYDRIAFLYTDSKWGSVLLPMMMVYKGGKYALMDPSGFLVSRFCDTEEDLSSAYIVGPVNEFKITDTIPEKFWGF